MRGDGSVFERDGIWYIRFRRNGKEIRMSTGLTVAGDHKKEAKNKLRDELVKSKTPQYVMPDQRKVTIGQLHTALVENYRAHGRRTYDFEKHWKHLAPVFEHIRAADLITAAVDAYRKARIKEGASQTTVNRELATMRRMYRVALRHQPPLVAACPYFELTHENNARKRFYSADEDNKLCSAARSHSLWATVFVEMMRTYGWRRGELLSLRVQDVSLPDKLILLQTSKNGQPRAVVMPPNILMLVTALVTGKQPAEKLFPSLWEVRKMWSAVCAAAGVKDAHLHDWRRTSARNKSAAGVPQHVIMDIHGWRTASMFRRYAITNTADQLAMFEAVEKANPRKCPEVVSQAPKRSAVN